MADAARDDPVERNTMKFCPISMLIWMLSAIFHDPIHDFGLTIDRMAKIVMYIDHLIAEGAARGIAQNGGKKPIGMGREIPRMGRERPRTERKQPGFQKPQPDLSSLLTIQKAPIDTPKPNTQTPNTKNPITQSRKKSDSVIISRFDSELYNENVVFALPRVDDVYITTYFRAIQQLQIAVEYSNNNNMLKLILYINELIDSNKIFVIQHILSGDRFDKDSILGCIGDLFDKTESCLYDIESAYSDEVFIRTKELNKFILENMWRVINTMGLPVRAAGAGADAGADAGAGAGADMVGDSPEQRTDADKFLWINLFNGSLFRDIMRVIIFGKCCGLTTPPNIVNLYNSFLGLRTGQVGGSKRFKQMCGGAKMTISAFRQYQQQQREELKGLLEDWDVLSMETESPVRLDNYTRFYENSINTPAPAPPLDPTSAPPTPAQNRQEDARLIRKLHIERFSDLKKKVVFVRELERKRREQQARPDNARRHTRSLEDPTTIKDVIDKFMIEVKNDFDSLLAEEQLAEAAAEERDAAAPLSRSQRAVVYKISIMIAKKGLEYARDELGTINGLLSSNQLTPETLTLLPNLGWFCSIAIQYISGIQQTTGRINEAVVEYYPPNINYIEKDKYENLLYQLYLLGLICQHNRDGGGLPDIDSRLAAKMKETLGRPEHAAAYRAKGLVYLDNANSQLLFDHVERHPQNWRIINNSVPTGIKPKIHRASVCNIPARVDAAAAFSSCNNSNEEFHSMVMRVMDIEERTTYFTKHEFNRNKREVTINFNFNLGGLVIGNTISDIDLKKAPNVLSANYVLKEGIDTIINLWKQNPTMLVDDLWASLESGDNFKMWMRIITKKGKGDIDQENSVLVGNSGYETLIAQLPNSLQRSIAKKLLFAGGDRPSSARTINASKYATNLQKNGILGVSYASDTQSFTLVHNELLRGIGSLNSVLIRSGGSRQRSKKHRLFNKKNVNHTRKKRVYRK